jgi:hypothetical protein
MPLEIPVVQHATLPQALLLIDSRRSLGGDAGSKWGTVFLLFWLLDYCVEVIALRFVIYCR